MMFARELISVALLVALACLPMTACSQSKAGNTTTPGASYQDGDDPLTELARLEQQMLALGISAASAAPTEAGADAVAGMDGDMSTADDEAGAGAEVDAFEEAPAAELKAEPSPPPPGEQRPGQRRARADRCEAICDLNVAICDLEGQICSLSESHQGDPTYVDACRRAEDDCAVAGKACDECDV